MVTSGGLIAPVNSNRHRRDLISCSLDAAASTVFFIRLTLGYRCCECLPFFFPTGPVCSLRETGIIGGNNVCEKSFLLGVSFLLAITNLFLHRCYLKICFIFVKLKKYMKYNFLYKILRILNNSSSYGNSILIGVKKFFKKIYKFMSTFSRLSINKIRLFFFRTTFLVLNYINNSYHITFKQQTNCCVKFE